MILTHSDLFSKISINENKINVLVIENQPLFTKMILDFDNQTNNQDGGFILSTEEYENVNIYKHICFISNPVFVSLNDKKILNKVYSKIKEVALNDENYHKTSCLFANVSEYINSLANDFDFDIDISQQFDMVNLLKAIGLELYEKDLSLADKLLDYFITVRELLNVNIFVLVNLKSYISDEDIELFEKSVLDHKINLILLESIDRKNIIYEDKIIIDKDLCEI